MKHLRNDPNQYIRLMLVVVILLALALATASGAARKAKKARPKAAAPQSVRPPAPPPVASTLAPGKLTFFVISDIHYNWPKAGSYSRQRAAIQQMNEIPGKPYPPDIGGTVDVPSGVIVLGDLTDAPGNGAWSAWLKDFGLAGGGLLHFPVFEGLGNHDAGSNETWDSLKKRNARRPGLQAVSANGLHYAWVWNGIHFVMTGIFPGNAKDPSANDSPNPRGALDFLYQYLRTCVGDSGRPVVLLQHFPLVPGRWWSEAQLDSFNKVIQGYNILCLLHGHSHIPKVYKWRGIDILDDGGVKRDKSNFFIFRIEDTRLVALGRTVDGTWGKLRLEKTFSYGKANPAAPNLAYTRSNPPPITPMLGLPY